MAATRDIDGELPRCSAACYSFNVNDGTYPVAPPVLDDSGALIGTIYGGGSGLGGVVYRLVPNADYSHWTESTLHNFNYGAEAYLPQGILLSRSGVIYGTTDGGGSLGGGTVFRLTRSSSNPTTWDAAILAEFPLISGLESSFPSVEVEVDGSLFGITSIGSNTLCLTECGTVFRVTPPSNGGTPWTLDTLYAFAGGTDGANPISLLYEPRAHLFVGLTALNVGAETAFTLTPPDTAGPWTKHIIFRFDSLGEPAFLHLDRGGRFYGTLAEGPAGTGGSVFSLAPPGKGHTGWTEATLFNFDYSSKAGSGPLGLVRNAQGGFFGTSYTGGTYGFGTIFELVPPQAEGESWTERVLYSFSGGADGNLPLALVKSKDGRLFGVTQNFLTNALGTVFMFVP